MGTAQRVLVRTSETQSSVEISGASPADGGSYTVVVRNKEGSANHTVSLSVIGETVCFSQAMIPSLNVLVFTIWFVCRPTWPTSIATSRFPAYKRVLGPVLDGSQLRRRQSCAGLHCGGQTRGLGWEPGLDWTRHPLQKHVLPRPLGPGASGKVPLPG